jgi:hypothetical protein
MAEHGARVKVLAHSGFIFLPVLQVNAAAAFPARRRMRSPKEPCRPENGTGGMDFGQKPGLISRILPTQHGTAQQKKTKTPHHDIIFTVLPLTPLACSHNVRPTQQKEGSAMDAILVVVGTSRMGR